MHTSGRIEPYFAARAAAISRNTAKTIEQFHSLESVLIEEIKFPISYAWLNDGLELFFDPTGTGAGFAQFVLSPLGDVYDSRIDFAPGSRPSGNLDWNPAVTVATATTDAQYIIEIRIPFDKFLPTPTADDSWRVNVCRAKPTVQAWSPTFGILYNAPRFGTMSFASPPRRQP